MSSNRNKKVAIGFAWAIALVVVAFLLFDGPLWAMFLIVLLLAVAAGAFRRP